MEYKQTRTPHLLYSYSLSGIILTSQIVFPVGEVGSDRVECSEVSVDNNILDWSWQLSVMLDSSLYDQPIILSSNDTTLFVNVIDNEGNNTRQPCTLATYIIILFPANSVSVHFETDSVAVTEGHRTVVCVVLDGVPTGGMSEDLPLTLLLANNTAGTNHQNCHNNIISTYYFLYANRTGY